MKRVVVVHCPQCRKELHVEGVVRGMHLTTVEVRCPSCGYGKKKK